MSRPRLQPGPIPTKGLNEGSGVSIDDAVQEMQATFVARMVEPWSVVQSAFNTGIGGQTIQ